MSVILITGAATGIGNLTARRLAREGHRVYASMRDPAGRNVDHADALLHAARGYGGDLRVLDLDVQSEDSARGAVARILEGAGELDVVVHNAGHLSVGFTEAFTAEDIARLIDINVLGAHRVNRAVLPHMRARRAGTLLYVGSTSPVSMSPFLAPYVASKAAFDALARVMSYETAHFGIETTIVMPGAFTRGTAHFPNASQASDGEIAAAYAALAPLVEQNEQATERLFAPGSDPDPDTVADEIARLLALPRGEKPLRTVIDFTHANSKAPSVEDVNATAEAHQADFVKRMGFGELLALGPREPEARPA